MSTWKRPVTIIVIVFLIICLVFVWYSTRNNPNGYTTKNPKATNSSSSISLVATGDFIAHDSVNKTAKQDDGNYNYLPMMRDIQPFFQKSDIRFCNDPILNGGTKFGISGYPKFNSPSEFVADMNKFGCNLVNTASNHSFDKTQEEIDASVDTWSKTSNMLGVVGQNKNQQQHDQVDYFTIKGVKFAFLAYTTYMNSSASSNSYGANVFDKEFASEQIVKAKKDGAKFIIVSMRWGTEYSPDVDDKQRQTAQWLANQGVNLVLGHGPHVLQTVQELTGPNDSKTLVWYSLGNFINAQLPAETLFNGLAYMDINPKSLAVTNLRYLPIYMHYEWTKDEASRQSNEDLLKRHNLNMYLLEDVKQDLIDKHQLSTTASEQKARIEATLNKYLEVRIITSKGL